MEKYEKLWNDKKLELATKIMKAPNANAASREALELARMIEKEYARNKKEDSEKAPKKPIDELVEVIRPVAEYMKQHFNSMGVAIITGDSAQIMSGEIGTFAGYSPDMEV